MTLANLLTLFRLIAVPFVLYLLVSGETIWAFILFLGAGVTDVLDGYIARKFNQKTRLGAILDPLADKSLFVSLFFILTYLGKIPVLLTALIVLRDCLILLGISYLHLKKIPLVFKPLRVSKINTFFQVIYISTIFIQDVYFFSFIKTLRPFILGVLVLTTCVSGALYARVFRTLKRNMLG